MRVVSDPAELSSFAGGAFVPLLGALHHGHLALIRRARELAGHVVISIFVNPTQFGPGEDYEHYPRALEPDLDAAAAIGVDVAFVPDVETIYPPNQNVPVPPLPEVATTPGLEDAHRPGHLSGVCQVVARLFDLVRPTVAIFGEKDYQQLLVVESMVEQQGDRWPGLRIEPHPTVRDPDGLALSSRNAYLKSDERGRALGLFRALQAAGAAGHVGAAQRIMRATLQQHDLAIDYAVVRDARTLEPVRSFDRPTRGLIAARLGPPRRVRLIDNAAIGVRPV
ncbi:MAG: pantoate--beta-alanine ligase [Planctomycetes bacterium]|nr:pantoate--beta-alanine ligase [Planctomycetota bacterium]